MNQTTGSPRSSNLAAALGYALLGALLAGCESHPCPLTDNLADLRACYCELRPAVAAAPPEASRAEVLQGHLRDLLSEDFGVYARAGEALVDAGEAALPVLFAAPSPARRGVGLDQDPVDRIILVILETDLDDDAREAMLHDPDPMHRLYAVRSIRFRRAGGTEGARLIAALDDANFHVREEAIEAIHALIGESRRRKPRNVLYRTPSLRQQREIWVWKWRWKREGEALFAQTPDAVE